MGRHKKTKITIPNYYQFSQRLQDNGFVPVDKRVKNGIKELHEHKYINSGGFIDLKFYLQRELYYIKIYLEQQVADRRNTFWEVHGNPKDPRARIASCVLFMEHILKHLPEKLFIQLPYRKTDTHFQRIYEEYDLYLDKALTPLSESQIIEIEKKPDYVDNCTKAYPYWSKHSNRYIKGI